MIIRLLLSVFLFAQSIGGAISQTNQTHAIIELSQHCLIGGVQNGKWIKADEVGAKLKDVQKFSLYDLNGSTSQITTSKIEKGDENDPCSDFWSAETSSKAERGIAIVSTTWNVMPRIPKAISLNDAIYVKIVRGILKSKGIKNPQVKITQAYKIDLEGDGKDEVVIAANRYAQGITPSASAGDYSFLLVRKIIGGRVQNIFISEEYYPKAKDSAVPGDNHISAIADLNGDGVMELVTYGGYYEGSGSMVFEIKGNKATSVLDCSCGV
jgi:hypothetical protein